MARSTPTGKRAAPIQFGLGVGGKAPSRFDVAQIRALQDELREFPERIATARQAEAVKAAAKIGEAALRLNVSTMGQVTGNLSRAITTKSKTYRNNRWQMSVPVAIVGYRRSGTGDSKTTEGTVRIGNDRAFHSHLVEFGTKRRFPGKNRVVSKTRGIRNGRRVTTYVRRKDYVDPNAYRVMTSFHSRGPFKTSRGGSSPPYPFSFIAKVDPKIGLGRMPAFHLVEHSFERSRPAMQAALAEAMEKALEGAAEDVRNGLG